MDSTGVIVTQTSERGKWHMARPNSVKTVCGVPVDWSGAKLRSLDLVDSSDRCQTPECKLARAEALGLTT